MALEDLSGLGVYLKGVIEALWLAKWLRELPY